MNIKKLLPVLVLLLAALWLFLPDTGNEAQTPAATPVPIQSLQTAAPAQTPKPSPMRTQKPAPAQTPKPIEMWTTKPTDEPAPAEDEEEILDEYGSYTTKEDVALYIYTYGHLPDNFIRKKDAQALGWTGGSLEKVLPGMCIGGDYFGNYEGQLPKAKGRRWTECDINTLGARSRGAERIIFSNDGLIYYTPDHYESFELLYG